MRIKQKSKMGKFQTKAQISLILLSGTGKDKNIYSCSRVEKEADHYFLNGT